MTAISTGDAVAVEAGGPDPEQAGSRWGPVPLIAFFSGVGLLVCSIAIALSRATLAPSPWIYWAGFLIIVVPILYRLLLPGPSASERLALVCTLGLALYLVKVVRAPFLFTLPDEFLHGYNAYQIDLHHHLFHSNPILPISAYYTGLEGATSALASVSGISIFASGLIVVGAARLTLMIALFLLFQRISGSARVAGLGAALYAANFNFLLFGAQYSYESLALPLLVIVLWSLAERGGAPREWARAWAIPIVLVTAAIVVTHHLTAYALIVILVALSALYWYLQRRVEWPNPWRFAVLATGLTGLWLLAVASATVGYLAPLLGNAFTATLNTLTGSQGTRGLFQSAGRQGGTVSLATTPTAARIVAVASIAILAIGLPFGLWRVWQRHRTDPFALILSAAAIGFFGILALRLSPAAWEIGSRAGEFVFIGLAFVVAFACVLAYSRFDGRGPRWAPWLGRGLLTACLGIVLLGGAIAGWAWDAQLQGPLRVKAQGRTIESESLGLANWAGSHLAGQKFAAGDADGHILEYPGLTRAFDPGTTSELGDILDKPQLASWQVQFLRRLRLRYVVADRRQTGEDNTRGYFFSVRPPAGPRDPLQPRRATTKFERIPTAARIFDSGKIVVYDINNRR